MHARTRRNFVSTDVKICTGVNQYVQVLTKYQVGDFDN
jgi:hypothetical protein